MKRMGTIVLDSIFTPSISFDIFGQTKTTNIRQNETPHHSACNTWSETCLLISADFSTRKYIMFLLGLRIMYLVTKVHTKHTCLASDLPIQGQTVAVWWPTAVQELETSPLPRVLANYTHTEQQTMSINDRITPAHYSQAFELKLASIKTKTAVHR